MNAFVGFRGSVEERFAAKVAEPDENGCLIWIGAKNQFGYGQIRIDHKAVVAHRWAWERANGPIPEGLVLDHLCRVRACVNHHHLEPVTHRVNILRGVGYSARAARKTHCSSGHPFDEANTYRNPKNGHRTCRTCRREGMRTYSAARRAS